MKNLLILLTFFFPIINVSAEWFELDNAKPMFVVSATDKTATIFFNLDGFEMQTEMQNGQNYNKISYPDEGRFIENGLPDLPRFSRLIAIPGRGDVTVNVNIIEQQTYENITVFPAQELQSENIINRPSFRIDEDFYSSDRIFPPKIAETDEPAILRDFRVVNVTVNPFQYNAADHELVVFHQLEIEVKNNNSKLGINPKLTERKLSRFFEPLYKSTILNYDEITSRENGYQDPCYLFIYAEGSEVLSNLKYISDWKHQKGFEVHLASTLETGTTLQEIKDFIQNAYDSWQNPPEFVCLVGDAGNNVPYNVPTAHIDGGSYNGEGDHFYSLLEGDDILADVFLGRLSFSSIAELQTIATKILHYEKEPYLDSTDWYNTALLVGDPTNSGTSTIDTKKNVRDMIALNKPNMNFTEVYDTSQGTWQMQMSNNLNSGVSYFNYRGFANMSGFSVYNINNLNNGYMLPAAIFITCLTGDFEGTTDCRSEAFLKAGTPTQPKGAIGAIATATGNTHTCFNNCVDAGIYYGIFNDKIYNLGGALVRAKLSLYMNYPGNPGNHVYQFSYWNNLMGDPGCELWTEVPEEMIVNYNTTIPAGSNQLPVQVLDSSGNPLKNAWVSILQGNDEIRETAFTDEAGNALLELPDNSAGEVQLTVTKHNFIPHSGSFNIQQTTSFIVVEAIQIDDDNNGSSSGNGDGIINPGESVELVVTLQNAGTQNANSVTAVISSNDDFITITDDTETFGNIPVGANAVSIDDFDCSIDAAVRDNMEIDLQIIIIQDDGQFWVEHLLLPISAPLIEFSELQILDGANGILDPGETALMEITLENNGSISANDIWAELVCTTDLLLIVDNNGSFGNINPGSSSVNITNRFELTALASVVPETEFQMTLNIFNNDGYQDAIEFPLIVGVRDIHDPTGNISCGYYCYDDEDTDYLDCPVYDWLEIDPEFGGDGHVLNFLDPGNSGQTEQVDLPFTLTFFGEEYNTISICSNGWAAPGFSDNTSFMNWTIPGPMGPSPMIAPFWDDLMVINGKVVYKYFEAMHIFVIEWSRVLNEYNGDEETFQLIIYDQNYYPASNNNNKIKFQYQTVSNVDQGSYGTALVGHGQYATVGIESHSGNLGLEYTYNNTYPLSAKPLENEMAILFAGEPQQYVNPYLAVGDIAYDDANGNGILEYGESADLHITLNNLGQSLAENVSAEITSNDPMVTTINNFSLYNNILGYGSAGNQTAFSIQISELCPNGYYLPFEMNVTSDNGSWTLYFSLIAYAPDIRIIENNLLDGNNHILDPGESGQLQLTLENQGLSDANSVSLLATTTDIYFNVLTGMLALGDIPAGTSLITSIDISLAGNAPIQHEGIINFDFNSSTTYSQQTSLGLFVSQVPVAVNEDFSVYPPLAWDILSAGSNSGGWSYSNTNLAGGTAPEIVALLFPGQYYDDYLITPVINTLGSTTLELMFKHSLLINLRNFEVSIETTSDGIHWNEVWAHAGTTIPPQAESLLIESPDVGSASFQLAFRVCGNTQQYMLDGWIIDDFSLNSITIEPHGYIAGNVSLAGGNGNLRDVEVSAGNITKNPDENGNYVLTVNEGTYDVRAFLPGYVASTLSGVNVQNWQTVGADFILEEITTNNGPQNLSAEINYNDVTLSWDIPGSEVTRNNKKNVSCRERDFVAYQIYKEGELIAQTSPIDNTEYVDPNMNSGIYSYYVTALYSDGESEPSNTIEVEITLAPPSNVSYQITAPMMVLLLWDPPEEMNRNFSFYRVYRDSDLIADDVLQTFYFDNYVTMGLHVYGICAVYGNYESDPVILQVNMTDTDNNLIPDVTILQNNYPNPFNPETRINFSLHQETHTVIGIYNLKGEKVRNLVNEILPAARHSILWNGKDDRGQTVCSGIYFYRMQAGNYSAVRKMIMLK